MLPSLFPAKIYLNIQSKPGVEAAAVLSKQTNHHHIYLRIILALRTQLMTRRVAHTTTTTAFC